jgi:hypothetical protein
VEVFMLYTKHDLVVGILQIWLYIKFYIPFLS